MTSLRDKMKCILGSWVDFAWMVIDVPREFDPITFILIVRYFGQTPCFTYRELAIFYLQCFRYIVNGVLNKHTDKSWDILESRDILFHALSWMVNQSLLVGKI